MKTHEKFTQEIIEVHNGKIKVIGIYNGVKSKIKVECTSCQNQWDATPSNLLQGRGCPDCGRINATKSRTKSPEKFIEEFHNLVGDEYTLLSNYINAKTNILIKHNTCGSECETTPNKFLGGVRCAVCAGNKKKTTKGFKEEVYISEGNNYIVLGEYVNNLTKLSMKHELCGHTFEIRPSEFTDGCRCPYCAGKRWGELNVFSDEVKRITNNEFEVLDSYNSTKEKIRFEHKECGHIFYMTPSAFLSGQRCPKCNTSKAEKRIQTFLLNNDIQFNYQFYFEDCKSIRVLPFDFAIFKDNKLMFLIEYDGRQHFEPVRFGEMTDEEMLSEFERIKKHDSIKNEYCEQNNIPLLRIPYWDFDNIEEIIDREMNKYVLQVL